jgi:hypothetical protein
MPKLTSKHVVRVKLTTDVAFDPNGGESAYVEASRKADELIEAASAMGATKSDRQIKKLGTGQKRGPRGGAVAVGADDEQEAA